MPIITRKNEQEVSQDAAEDNGEARTSDTTIHEDDYGFALSPPEKSDGRIKPGEVRNRWGRKGKPKKEKTVEEMTVEALMKFVDVPQRDGSIQRTRLIQCLIESTIAKALSGNLYQRLALLRQLDRNGDFARYDASLNHDWDEYEKRRFNELNKKIEEIERLFNEGPDEEDS